MQIGKTLVDLMLQWAPFEANQLVTFAVDPDSIPETARRTAYPHTMKMLLEHPHLRLMDMTHISDYRGIAAYWMRLHVLKTPVRRKL